MALDAANVDVALTGAVSYAATSEAAPADADTPLGAGWRDVGYLSDDGVVEARDRSTNNIVGWQNADVVRTTITETEMSVQFTMIESNPNSIELFYAAPVDPLDGSVEIVPSQTGGRRSLVVDYIDGDKFVRLYLPQAEVLEVGESTLTSGDPVGYDVTVRAYPDGALGFSGKKFYSALVTP